MENQIRIKKIAFALCGYAAFALLALLVTTGKTEMLDSAVRDAVLDLRNGALSAFFVPFAYSGNWFCVVPACLILLAVPALRRTYGVPTAAAVLTAQAFYNVLKRIFCRERPDFASHLVKEHGFSFPSGHSITSFMMFAMLAALILYYARTGGESLPVYKNKPAECRAYFKGKSAYAAAGLCAAYIVLMGFARIYVGVHWPSDVLGSWLLGAANMSLFLLVFFGGREKKARTL